MDDVETKVARAVAEAPPDPYTIPVSLVARLRELLTASPMLAARFEELTPGWVVYNRRGFYGMFLHPKPTASELWNECAAGKNPDTSVLWLPTSPSDIVDLALELAAAFQPDKCYSSVSITNTGAGESWGRVAAIVGRHGRLQSPPVKNTDVPRAWRNHAAAIFLLERVFSVDPK